MRVLTESSLADEVFVGRQAELTRLGQVVDRVRQGQPWLVTIEGESGLGKTALARRMLAATDDWTIAWSRSAPAESDLDYGVVHQLLRGVSPDLLLRHRLHGDTIEGSSPFGIGARLLGVVGDLQADGPVAIVIDDIQWTDPRSVEALSFMLRRLTVDPVMAVVVVRGDRDHLDEPTRRMLLSIDQRLRISLDGLGLDDVAPLAAALGARPLSSEAARLLHTRTGGHTLYLRSVLSEADRTGTDSLVVPPSLAASIGDQLAVLPGDARALLEMLAVLNVAVPLAQLGAAAGIERPSSGIEPALRAGLVDWSPHEASCPVAIRHALQRDAIYGAIAPGRRRELHARAVPLVDDGASWAHRVASLDRPDEDLAGRLEVRAGEETAAGALSMAATHLLWASDISETRDQHERRLLTAALHLMLSEEARGLALREAVESSAPSPLRSCVLGTIAFTTGQLGDAEQRFAEAFAQVRDDEAGAPLAALVANRLAGTYILLGHGPKVIEFARWAIDTGRLDPAADSQTRTLVAIGTSQVDGPEMALAELAHLDPDPARIAPVDVDGLSFRGVFRLLSGDLGRAIEDLRASLSLARNGATITLGLRAYAYLALAQYFAGAWDEALLTSEQALSAAAVHARQFELPLLHLAAACVPAARGSAAEAEDHVRLAEDAAAALDYSQERVYASTARALLFQASGDSAAIAAVMGEWLDDAALDDRSRMYSVLWRPLLAEGLVGAGRVEEARLVIDRLRSAGSRVGYLRPAVAWLEGWLAETEGDLHRAESAYRLGEEGEPAQSPVYEARLLLAHGRLLRRTGRRRLAVERLRRAGELYRDLRAAPFLARVDSELAACGLRQVAPTGDSILSLTSRETEVAHLVGRGMTNAEIASELYVTPKAVGYHLGNIYAKLGVKGRQQLRRYVTEPGRPAGS